MARNPAYPAPRPRRRRRRLVALALVCVLAVVVGGGFLLWPDSPTQPDSSGAFSANLAADANTLRATDPGLAAQLAVAAYRDGPTEPAADQLYASLNTPLEGLVGNTGSAVLRVAAATDAPLAVASDQDQTLRVWNTADPAAPVLDATIKAGGTGVALTARGTLLASSCGTSGGTCLWDLTDPHRPTTLATLPKRPDDPTGKPQITSMAISPDSSLLAAAAEQGFTLLWSIADPRHPRFLTTLSNPTSDGSAIAAVAFASHGNLLAQTVLRGKTSLWDVTNPSAPAQVATMDGGYAAVAVSPDGSLLAAVGDFDVVLWNIQQPAKPAPITVDPIAATGTSIDLSTVTFSKDGSQLAFAGSDTNNVTGELCTLDLYPANLNTDVTFPTCTATGFSTFTMAATANGVLFAGGFDGAVRLWRSALRKIPGAVADDYSWATSPNGRLLAAPMTAPNVQPPSSVGVWDIGGSTGPSLDATLSTSAHVTTFLTSTTLLVAAATGTVQLWDLTDPHHPVQGTALGTASVPSSATGWPLAAAVGADRAGDLVTVLDQAGLLHLWRVTGAAHASDVGSIQPTAVINGPTGVLPDGHTAWLLTSAGMDWWDIRNPAHPTHLGTSPFGAAYGVMAGAGRLVASTVPEINGGKADLDLFDLSGGRPSGATTVSSSVDGISAIGQDGTLLAAGGIGDNSVMLWDIRDPRQPHQLATVSTLAGTREIGFDHANTRLVDWNEKGLEMWNIHDPAAPVHVASMSLRQEGVDNPGTIYTAGFTEQDGQLVAVTDSAIMLFDVDPAKLADRLCSYTGTAITPAQWQKYAPGVPYRKPCG
ncbi:WD40 repeat domain-containing protein [Kutzneria sp. CA-103260]|uniref:WD40 repeat domain-containing protein n=1 Tax=Kutzneria sp. CA-103260 TaxID=2802641 RepID=UPI001BA8F158|nr:WD40 repeat domain-containing protein [Kutzneria sp. CA-103260]